MALPTLGLTTQINLIAFTTSGPTIGFETSTESARALLPVSAIAALVTAQLRVFNDSDETAYIELGDENVVAEAWTGPPPLTCSFVLAPMSVVYLTIPKDAGVYVAAVLYSGNGGIYFTPGAGVWSG